MIIEVSVSIVSLFLLVLLIRRSSRTAGSKFFLKKIVARFLLAKRKRNNVYITDNSFGYGSNSNPVLRSIECAQRLKENQHAIDSAYFCGRAKDGTWLVVRIGRRLHRRAEVWLTLHVPGIGVMQNPVHPGTAVYNTHPDSFSAAGLTFACVDPGRTWRITSNGLLRKGLCNETTEDSFETVHVKFSFLWNALTPIFDFDTDVDGSLLASGLAREPWSLAYFRRLQQWNSAIRVFDNLDASEKTGGKQSLQRLKQDQQNHYGQGGEMRGVISVEGFPDRNVILKSLRDHTFGLRNWSDIHRYIVHYGWLEDGTFFNLSTYCVPGVLSNFQCGWVAYPNSEICAISYSDVNLPNFGENCDAPNEYIIKFKAGVRCYQLRVERGLTPRYYHSEAWDSVCMESMCTYEGAGTTGLGVAEFCYRRSGGDNPDQPEVSVTSVCEEESCGADELTSEHLALPFTDPRCTSTQLVGGKGSQLARLTQLQLPDFIVPKGFCLGIDAFDLHLSEHPDIIEQVTILTDVACGTEQGDLAERCARVTQSLTSGDICGVVQKAIERHLRLTFGADWLHEDMTFAVRSSATGEDSEELSAAGQMDTILGVKGLPHILAAVRKCWASYFALPATQYRRQHGQPIYQRRRGDDDGEAGGGAMGVVIQQMVPADAAGVLFTRDPVTGNPGLMTVNANYGLGESVVSGSTQPDNIVISRSWRDELAVKEKLIGSKRTIVVVDGEKPEGGTSEKEPTLEESSRCSISDDVILKLAQIGVLLEKHYSDGQDIEWAVQGNSIYILQTRPITTLGKMSEWELLHEFDTPVASDTTELLTTGNIGEMMPGAMTPLAVSTFMRAVNHAIGDMYVRCGTMAQCCTLSYLQKIMHQCANHGFINLNMAMSMNETTSTLGSLEMCQLSLIGEVNKAITLDMIRNYHGTCPFWRRLLNFLQGFLHLKASTAKTKRWEKMLETLVIGQKCGRAVDLYNEIDRQLPIYFQAWTDTICQSANSALWSNALISTISSGEPEWKTQHYSDVAVLLSKCEDVYSADVPAAMQKLAQCVVETGQAKEFTSKSAENAVKWLEGTESGAAGRQYAEFLARHGHRCIREAEMREKSWRSEPAKLVRVLQRLVEASGQKFSTSHRVVDVDEAISRIQTPISNGAKFALRRILPRARQSVGGREWGKSISIKMIEAFKRAYWRLAELMVREGRLPDQDLLMFLSHQEIAQVLATRSGSLIAKAQRRRRLLDKQMSTRFHRINFGHPIPLEDESEAENVVTSTSVKGLPVSQGTVKGTARVVTSLQNASLIQPGDILIVHFTDVGWTPYFPLIGGLVTEIGGLVSHGAVVAREYGLPCVVNCQKATQIFKSDGRYATTSALARKKI